MSYQKIEDLLERYLSYCQIIRNFSEATISTYRSTFKILLKDTQIEFIHQLTKPQLEKWFYDGRIKRHWKPVTFRSHHKQINPFFKWLVKEGIVEENIAAKIEKPRLEQRLPRALNHNDAQLILDTSFNLNYRFRYERFRNHAVIAIMLFAGLRKSEVTKLKVNCVDLKNRTIFINQGKGAKDRIVPINSKLYRVLSDYLVDRNRLYPNSTDFFVAIGREKPFGTKGINNLIKKLKDKTKIKFSAHILRHTFATLMLEGGCDIYTLSKIMGHSKITTTTIYLSCSSQQMGKAVEKHYLN